MKKKLIITSAMTIVMCLALITGATFAYFTSRDETSIAVNSAKVNITATIDTTSLEKWSINEDRTNEATFTNGGTATLTADGLELALVSPGDGVKFDILIDNESNISIKYNVRMVIEIDEEGKTADQIAACEALKNYLAAKAIIGNDEYAITGTACETGFVLVGAGVDEVISVIVDFPALTTDQNDAQNASVTIKFVVEAVQGNGEYVEETTSSETETN